MARAEDTLDGHPREYTDRKEGSVNKLSDYIQKLEKVVSSIGERKGQQSTWVYIT